MGVAHVPEGRGTFVALTVEENLRLALHTRRDRAAAMRDMDLVFDYFPGPEGTLPASRPAPCPAASSRCWRSAER